MTTTQSNGQPEKTPEIEGGAEMCSWQKENIATMTICAGIVLGLYALGAGTHSFWGFTILLNLNYPKGGEK